MCAWTHIYLKLREGEVKYLIRNIAAPRESVHTNLKKKRMFGIQMESPFS